MAIYFKYILILLSLITSSSIVHSADIVLGTCEYDQREGYVRVLTPLARPDFSFCMAVVYCNLKGEVTSHRPICSVVDGECPVDAKTCLDEKFSNARPSMQKQKIIPEF